MSPMIMQALQEALDSESYEWMAERYPRILKALEREISGGKTPDQIRLFVLLQTGRPEIAQRCEQVARHIMTVSA